MVNRVDGGQLNNSYSYGYGRKQHIPGKEDVPEFLLKNDENGVIWERNNSFTPTKKDSYEHIGDKNSKEKEEPEKPKTHSDGILAAIRRYFRRIFNYVWYGDSEGSISTGTNTEEDKTKERSELVGLKQTEDESHAMARVQSNNTPETILKQTMAKQQPIAKQQTLTRPARSTTLLTYYDRHGRIVVPTGSDAYRLLHGDRGVKKL